MTTTHTDQVIQTDSIITDDEGLLAQAVEAATRHNFLEHRKDCSVTYV